MRCCPKAKRDWSKVCCCLPLGGFVLLVAICFLGVGIYDAIQTFGSKNLLTAGGIVAAIFVVLQIITGILGLIAVAFRNTKTAAVLALLLKIFITISIVRLIVTVVVSILNVFGILMRDGEKWRPTGTEIAALVVTNVITLLYVVVAYWCLSGARSFHMVLKNGGHGWEYKNYKDLKLDKALADDSDED